MVEGKEKEAALAAVAEVVGSTPTRSTFIILVKYGIKNNLKFGYCRKKSHNRT
jgi:hypothetical protein